MNNIKKPAFIQNQTLFILTLNFVGFVFSIVSRSLTRDLIFIFISYFSFPFYFISFIFLFLEQLGLRAISHAVTSVTT